MAFYGVPILAYPNVQKMYSDTTLKPGCYAYTLGNSGIDDNGLAIYKITAELTAAQEKENNGKTNVTEMVNPKLSNGNYAVKIKSSDWYDEIKKIAGIEKEIADMKVEFQQEIDANHVAIESLIDDIGNGTISNVLRAQSTCGIVVYQFYNGQKAIVISEGVPVQPDAEDVTQNSFNIGGTQNYMATIPNTDGSRDWLIPVATKLTGISPVHINDQVSIRTEDDVIIINATHKLLPAIYYYM